MCGIAGFIGIGDRRDALAMRDAVRHRGPDDDGLWIDEERGVHLTHTRLAIIDPVDGRQPMCSRDGSLVVVFNGEIYNHVELRDELQRAGHTFRTSGSDTEVLLHGYRQWGHELPQRLNGMWAFALYDRSQAALFLSRDRFGEKPLFYTLQDGTFAFGSELAAVTAHRRVAADVAPLSVQKYMAYGFLPAPNTIYRQIYKLPGGHNLLLDVANLSHRLKRYWQFQLDPVERVPRNALREWSEQLRELLAAAVRRQMMSDVPLGVFLSGGIDSSLIAALAAREVAPGTLKVFSLGFDDQDFDESGFAGEVASHIHAPRLLERFSSEDLPQTAAEVVRRLDEPLGDSSIVPTYALCRAARRHVTVAIGGDGADELFAGYDPFRAVGLARSYARCVPRPVHMAIRTLAALLPSSHGYMSLDFRIKRMLRGLSYKPALWNPVWLGPLEPDELRECFVHPASIEEVYSEALELWDACDARSDVERTMQFYVQLYLPDNILVKIDRAGMLCSLEVRSPFLDKDLVDFVRRIPTRFKIQLGRTKRLLREAARPLVPKRILRRRKHGFAFPTAHCFRRGLLRLQNDPLEAWLDRKFLEKRQRRHADGYEDNRMLLWSQWVLEQFLNARREESSRHIERIA